MADLTLEALFTLLPPVPSIGSIEGHWVDWRFGPAAVRMARLGRLHSTRLNTHAEPSTDDSRRRDALTGLLARQCE